MLHTEIPLKIKVRKATKFLDGPVSGKNELERYIMRSKPRGFLLIICNIDYVTLNVRTGAEHDAANLQKLFEDMGFQVTLKRNLTGAVSNYFHTHVCMYNCSHVGNVECRLILS